MKRLCLRKTKACKKGMASFYVVIFATILFGVVTVSFMRIILSEANQSSNDDLSRSAYDSAIAGVEDAKTAINRYYDCIKKGGTGSACDKRAYEAIFDEDCVTNGIGIARYLYGDQYNGGDENNFEVKIQETSPNGGDADNASDQAYTCVILKDTVPDYRGTLSKDTPSKAVPLAVYDSSGNQTSQIQDARKIRFSWFSWLNEGDLRNFDLSSDGRTLQDQNRKTKPPTIALTLIKVKKDMNIEQFHTPNNGAEYSTVVLLPTEQSDTTNLTSIDYNTLTEAGNVNKAMSNVPLPVVCSTKTEFACAVEFTGFSFQPTDSLILIVSLPYGDTAVDFSSTLYKDDDTEIPLVGVQVQVDSTGRTNQLFRRVEARLDPADLFFPYPQYELFLDGGDDKTLSKSFWITANCWHTHPKNGEDNTTKPQTCPNNAKINE